MRSFLLALGIILAGLSGPVQAAQPHRYALLVGCTRYDNLQDVYWLVGPGNDVKLMRDLLVDHYQFSPDDIVILSEQKGGDNRPTYAHIKREFHNLAEKAQEGDKVVIALGGHGSREPDSRPDDPEHFKPDGMEEIFLPADVQSIEDWDPANGRVKNGIADYEFRDWLKEIRAKKASVWVIFDACHSASLARGTEDEKAREVPADKLVPPDVMKKAQDRAKQKGEQGREVEEKVVPPFKLPPNEPDLVAIYAAQTTEPTYEKKLPPDAPDAQAHGILTYAICEILTQAKTPLTYSELVKRVHDQYTAWGRTYPTPLVEGKDQYLEVLGDKEHRLRTQIQLGKDSEGGWTINAGALQGLTAGSILAVYPPPGQADADKIVGYVQIPDDGLGTIQSKVKPCEHDRVPAPKDLPARGRCEPAVLNYTVRTKVAVDDKTDQGEPVPEALRQQLGEDLRKVAADQDSLIEAAASPAQAKWLLRLGSLASGKVYLVPASGVLLSNEVGNPIASDPTKLPTLYGPVPEGEERAAWLKERLGRIARAQNLLAFVTKARQEQSPQEDADVKVKVEMVRFRNPADKVGEPVGLDSPGVTLHKGDLVGFRVINEGRETTDVTLLLVNSDYGIDAVFPKGMTTSDNRLQPGKSFQFRAKVTSKTVTVQEHLVVIAVKAREVDDMANFSFLAQPSLEKVTRDLGQVTKRSVDRGFGSPLGQFFQTALYGDNKKRGLDTTTIEDYSFGLHTWQVSPAARGGKP